jgi:hypothetical protein
LFSHVRTIDLPCVCWLLRQFMFNDEHQATNPNGNASS